MPLSLRPARLSSASVATAMGGRTLLDLGPAGFSVGAATDAVRGTTLSEATPSKQPTITLGGPDGRPFMQFDTAERVLNGLITASNVGALSVLKIMRIPAAPGSGLLLSTVYKSSDTGNRWNPYPVPGGVRYFYGDGVAFPASSIVAYEDDTWMAVLFRDTGNGARVHLCTRQTRLSGTASSNVDPLSETELAVRMGDNTGSNTCLHDISRYVIFRGEMTDQDLARVSNAVRDEYGFRGFT